eukprot:m.118840 g.118840  ORF g.118840 m.118840 type:complete len:326 (+) comp15577_c0_seq3:73-1050(+)
MSFDKKEIVQDGHEVVQLADGDKAVFHFKTVRSDTQAIVDDSRTLYNGPFELRFGKQFLLPVWEDAVKTMKIGEVARFHVPSRSIESYPQLATVLRKESKRKHAELHGEEVDHHHHGHRCASSAMTGENKDLYELFTTEVYFEMELLSVDKAGEFAKDMWEMSLEERVEAIQQHKTDGNAMFKVKSYETAADHYSKALAHIETIENNARMPTSDVSQDVLTTVAVLREQCLLNLIASELPLKEYVRAVEHANMVVERGTTNPKAYFRRAQAHYQRGRDMDLAASDIAQARLLAPDDKAISALAAKIESRQKQQQAADRTRYSNMF